MKKKNLIILLILPFLIAIFCTTAINTTYNMIDVDISFINWDYNDVEAFRISDTPYQLKASGVNQRNYAVSGKDDLIWSVTNLDGTSEPYAEVIQKGSTYYLKALASGNVRITCSNKKGNVLRYMTGVIYKDAAILMYPKISASQSNIDPEIYYGQYDHTKGNQASIEMTVTAVPKDVDTVISAECSDNITFDSASGKINIVGTGKAFVTLSDQNGVADPITYNFTIVEDGVNVYTYEDLLNCTNRSEEGEIVVLRKHFESIENAYVLSSDGLPINSAGKPILKNDNTECFGNYDVNTGKFSFGNEIYSFKTTYNTEYIEKWNEFASTEKNYSSITDRVNVGLRIQKDFYGNGYRINLHNLTYPYAYIPGVGADGSTVRIPQLTADNLFRGPLKLYTLGDPNNTPLVSLYGQDNIGMYVDGDGIVVNDVNFKNCDFGDRIENLDTVGTVVEAYGNGIVLKNSSISNGKNVVRSFSSNDLVIKNCLISNSRNFLFLTGSNEYVPVDSESMATFYTLDGEAQTAAINSFISEGGMGDEIMSTFLVNYCESDAEKENMRKALLAIQSALNNVGDGLEFKGSTTIEDTYFYRSGISAICMETLFNSTFLEAASPSIIVNDIFGMMNSDGKSIVPYVPTEVSGVSYPVSLNLTGSTEFFDYKDPDAIDLGSLIEENMSDIAASIGIYDGEITIDNIFPLRSILMQKAKSGGNTFVDPESGKTYVNIPIAYYGGGLNLSTVTVNTESSSKVSSDVKVDLLDNYLNLTGSSSSDLIETLKGLVLKTVPSVMGFEPFKFNFVKDGYLYGETPKITDLIENAKGA